MNKTQILLDTFFKHSEVYIKFGLLVLAVWGGWKYFIADDKSTANISFFIFGSSGIGAYHTITKLLIDFVK